MRIDDLGFDNLDLLELVVIYTIGWRRRRKTEKSKMALSLAICLQRGFHFPRRIQQYLSDDG